MYSKVKDIFNICDVPTSADEIQALIDTMSDSIGTMAMVNYPYATDFVNPLPAWP
jgi:lysosomal Pro-X carboxypeptidase